MKADSRLWAAATACASPVKWRLISSIDAIWARPPSGPSTFHVEDRSQGWLTERGDSTVTLAAESHGKPNGCRCLPYA
jgi:hypothetical protein